MSALTASSSASSATTMEPSPPPPKPQVQPCRYKTGKTLGSGSYSTVRECIHIDTGRYYAAKVINKRLMAGREHMVSSASGVRDGGGADRVMYRSEMRLLY